MCPKKYPPFTTWSQHIWNAKSPSFNRVSTEFPQLHPCLGLWVTNLAQMLRCDILLSLATTATKNIKLDQITLQDSDGGPGLEWLSFITSPWRKSSKVRSFQLFFLVSFLQKSSRKNHLCWKTKSDSLEFPAFSLSFSLTFLNVPFIYVPVIFPSFQFSFPSISFQKKKQ